MTALILLISFVGILEMTNLWRKMEVKIWLPGVGATGALYVLSAYFVGKQSSVYGKETVLLGSVLLFSIALAAFFLVIKYPNFGFTDLAANVFTPLYAAWLLTHLLSLRQLQGGFHYVLLVLVATWSTDTLAYFVGMNFGKHRLAPLLSPKKSIEGAVGGVVGSVLASAVVGLVSPHMTLIHYILIGFLVGILGQIGDLTESALKRMAGVKDSGKIIPGHGGILDRFDSLLITSPLVYYYLRLLVIH